MVSDGTKLHTHVRQLENGPIFYELKNHGRALTVTSKLFEEHPLVESDLKENIIDCSCDCAHFIV